MTRKGQYIMNQNKTAKALKITSIIMFVVAIIVSIVISQSTIYGDYSYQNEIEFNSGLFFTTILSLALPCILIYGLGELIQISHDNRNYLAEIVNDKEKVE